MTIRKRALPALAFAAALVGGTALSTVPIERAAAQAATAPQPTQQPERQRMAPSQRVEGRIAYLKAELKITDAQAPQFDRVAQAMRDNAKDMDQAFAQSRSNKGSQNAVERLEMRSRFAALRAQGSQRYLDAFKPLYASLSDDQKKTADELLAPHHHHHYRG